MKDSITEIDKLKAYLEPGDEIIEAGCNSAGYYLKCSNGKLVMACINGDFPIEPVDLPKIAVGYQSVLAIGRWKAESKKITTCPTCNSIWEVPMAGCKDQFHRNKFQP